MAKTKKIEPYFFVVSLLFFASFYLLRALFEKIGWNYIFELFVSSLLSAVIAPILANLLYDPQSRVRGVLWSSFYFIFILVASLYFGSVEQCTSFPSGCWATLRGEENDMFVLDFFKKDTLQFFLNNDGKRVLGYSWDKNKMKIYDDDGNLLFNWRIKVYDDSLIVFDMGEAVVFYRTDNCFND